jgi:diketogulonate reductase-like aldo/keto reductase
MTIQDWTVGGKYYPIPNDLQLAVESLPQYCVLSYLIRCDWNKQECGVIPSVDRLMFNGLMARQTVIDAIRGLENKGYIAVVRKWGCSNKYELHMDVILEAIRKNMPLKDQVKIAHREYSTEQMNAITVRRSIQHPELAHKAETIMGNAVVNKDTGEILNEGKENG